VYEALREGNPAPYSALLELPGVDLVSASPELLLRRTGDRLVAEPIAGTRPRGRTPAADRAFERELRGSEKERAEHAMLVDLARNDLGKVAAYGSVDVPEYRRVDRYSEVMHLVSTVVARLRPEADLADAVAAVFPGGTVTGAPKPRTMAIIDEVESRRRGPYTGAIGVVGVDDRATLSMTIRTLTRHDGRYSLRVGGGVVHDSDPAAEYAESLDKARALVTALRTALDGRATLSVADASRRDA
jgi:anthranilate synthase component 1